MLIYVTCLAHKMMPIILTILKAGSPTYSPTIEPTVQDYFTELYTDEMRQKIENTVLVSYTPMGNIAYPSTKYLYDGMMSALEEMAIDGTQSDGRDFKFWIGDDEKRKDYGRTNLAAFLAMAMTESIQYDTCDEFNTDEVAGRYALSNACGQNSRSYQDEACINPNEIDMSCPVDTSMNVVSSGYSTNMIGRAPPPFSCRPQTDASDYAGYWDMIDGTSSNSAYGNALGRTDIESCCWWGRGILLTRGVCNIGKLNYYLGRRASVERGEGRFPSIDFCINPEATCAEYLGQAEDLRWITGMFEWIERVQSYRSQRMAGVWNVALDFDYIKNLKMFVDGGMTDDSFIDTVSSIFTRGCHLPNCSSLEIRKSLERKANFYKVLGVFGLPEIKPPPTNRPSPPPTTQIPTTPSPIRSILPPPPPPPLSSLPQPQPQPPTIISPPVEQVPQPNVPGLPTQPNDNTNWMPTLPVQQPDDDINWMPDLPTQPSIPTQQSTPVMPVSPTSTTIAKPTDSELIPLEDNPASLVLNSMWNIALLSISITYLVF